MQCLVFYSRLICMSATLEEIQRSANGIHSIEVDGDNALHAPKFLTIEKGRSPLTDHCLVHSPTYSSTSPVEEFHREFAYPIRTGSRWGNLGAHGSWAKESRSWNPSQYTLHRVRCMGMRDVCIAFSLQYVVPTAADSHAPINPVICPRRGSGRASDCRGR